jgi:hypothetical protein
VQHDTFEWHDTGFDNGTTTERAGRVLEVQHYWNNLSNMNLRAGVLPIANLNTGILHNDLTDAYHCARVRSPKKGATLYTVLGWVLHLIGELNSPAPPTLPVGVQAAHGLNVRGLPKFYAAMINTLYANRAAVNLAADAGNAQINFHIHETANLALRLRVMQQWVNYAATIPLAIRNAITGWFVEAPALCHVVLEQQIISLATSISTISYYV